MNYTCQFCKQDCQKENPKAIFYYCKPCGIFFHPTEDIISFRPDSPTHWYWLTIDYAKKTTEVARLRRPQSMTVEERMDMDPMQLPKTILQLPYAVQGVTPKNMYAKLKTLLVFQ